MSQPIKLEFTTPCSRLVAGDAMKKHQSLDDNGNPRAIKTGPNAGQPREDFYVGVAIPKTQQDWKLEPWGQTIVAAAHKGFPHLIDAAGTLLNPNMSVALKVIDGDSPHPNKAGSIPNQKEGYPGHWVINASTSGAPARLYKWNQQQGKALPLAEGDEIKRGYYIQLHANVDSNGSAQQPGVYINPEMICMIAYGDEIYAGPDVDSAGFGVDASQLPPGASTMPTAAMATPPAATPPAATPPAATPPAATPPVAPAHDLAQGPAAATPPPPPPPVVEATPPPVVDDPMLTYGGQSRKKSEWLAMPGWNEALVAQHCQPA